MRTSKNYQATLQIFREESDRLKKCAATAIEPEIVNYYSHMHLYLCAIFADIATATLSAQEKSLLLKWIQRCSSEMCAIVGNFYVKSYEKAKGDE